MLRWWFVLALAAAIIGCSVRPDPVAVKSRTPEEVAKLFAQEISDEDWGAAYELTSSHWQKRWTEEGTQSFYTVLARDFEKKAGKPLIVEEITVRKGELPKSPIEAKERFEITTEPPMESWKAWLIVELIVEGGKKAAELPMLIVEDQGVNRVGYVAFDLSP